MKFNAKTMLIAGHARLPQGMAAKNVFETLSITCEVDVKYGVILDATATLATDKASEFVGKILRGTSLRDGIEEQIEAIENHYRGKATNALIAAMKDLELHYKQIISEEI